MQNFLDCIRGSGQEPNCPFDLGFRVSIACRMAVESYRRAAHGALGRRERRDRLVPSPRDSVLSGKPLCYVRGSDGAAAVMERFLAKARHQTGEHEPMGS